MRYGNGAFGRWVTDDAGLPAYLYEMDAARDPRAAYFVTGGASRDHWHLLGNDRICATAHNGGYVQLYDWSRGGKALNRWEPDALQYAGGFKFIELRGDVFNTLSAGLPEGAEQERVFGAGYFEKRTTTDDMVIAERIDAPQGDDPLLLSTTYIVNTGDRVIEISVTEFWAVNPVQIAPAPIMTHGFGRFFERRRKRLNRLFHVNATWDRPSGVLAVNLALARPDKAPPPEEPSITDYYPKTVFLAALDSLPEGFRAFAVDGALFFDNTGLRHPPGVRGAADGQLIARRPLPDSRVLLAMRREARLEPGERITLRYAFGYEERERIVPLVARYGVKPEPSPRPMLAFDVPGAPWLKRELLWHSYYLQAGSFYSDYFENHFVDQGSAYSFMQGLSGASRDFFLFVLPMIYLRPELAREMLCFSMRAQDPDTGAFPYAHVGHGKLSGFVVHAKSSDLGLFFLWALAEYLNATRDYAFLDTEVPFYPLDRKCSGPVLDHARAAFRHLTGVVGIGPHDMLRCVTGDWNDALIAFSRWYPSTWWRGESSLNAGLAAFALPAFADAIDGADPGFASVLREFAEMQVAALRELWAGEWVARGYLGYFDTVLGKDRLFLDTQAFGVLAGVWDANQTNALFARIRSDCVAKQPAGALSMWPPMRGPLLDPGSDTNGGTWAAVDSWIAWAWSLHDPQQAWEFYKGTTLAAHAEAYPKVWYGIWSGPDSYNAHYHKRPGETFNVTFTPMTDYPVMNMNRHAGPLLDAIKFAGINPRKDAIVIDPRLPFNRFSIQLPLMGFSYEPAAIRGYYAPIAPGDFQFAIRPPRGMDLASARLTVCGEPALVLTDESGFVRFTCSAESGRIVEWALA